MQRKLILTSVNISEVLTDFWRAGTGILRGWSAFGTWADSNENSGASDPKPFDPKPFFGPTELGVSGLLQGDGLAASPKFCNEIGGLLLIAPCGRTSL